MECSTGSTYPSSTWRAWRSALEVLYGSKCVFLQIERLGFLVGENPTPYVTRVFLKDFFPAFQKEKKVPTYYLPHIPS